MNPVGLLKQYNRAENEKHLWSFHVLRLSCKYCLFVWPTNFDAFSAFKTCNKKVFHIKRINWHRIFIAWAAASTFARNVVALARLDLADAHFCTAVDLWLDGRLMSFWDIHTVNDDELRLASWHRKVVKSWQMVCGSYWVTSADHYSELVYWLMFELGYWQLGNSAIGISVLSWI